MSYQVLARKWRPKSFAELVGQEHVVKALSNALDQQRLHHAYLLTGTRGVGKTTVARILAKSLNCETGITSTPCGTCATCREIDAGRFIDLLELDAASNTGIDNMREVLDNAQYAPTAGRFKVYLIDEVHMLSKAAFNSMLKTLEEPPEHVKFILATTDPQKIPVTVLSRCLQFNLKQMLPSAIVGHLKDVLERESLPFDLPALQLLARSAQGSMRDALSLLDQSIAYGGGRVEEAQVRAMLGAIDQSYLFTLLEHLADSDGAGLIDLATQMEARSLSFDAALQDLGALLHQIALAQTVPQALSEDLPERQRILDLAQRFSPEAVQLHYQITLHGRKDLSLAPDEFAGFSMALLRMLAFTLDAAPTAGQPVRKATVPAAQAVRAVQAAAVVPQAEAPPPLKAQEPAPSPVTRSEPASDAAARTFDGDWPGLVAKLGLGGMAKMLANHCELKSYDGQRIELCVPNEHKHLMEKTYQDKLKAALDDYVGGSVFLNISLGSVTGLTPAKLDHQEKQARHAEAVAAIEQDPFVRDLVENLDAQVIESTIKPIE
ncbi:MAG: DNA polymerase III subunit gamma/tau [Sulfurimicrobium sp.]|jgi:DNA polymerase-3 subunit gamma/tau|nr:DNA polymerase III subunit gamma/tau [Sulfurimicrobium sp.]MDP1705401.1 DNA polymerase III subunit gamma/tau [Sulfurimicrobium sp.]MDP2963449.1 DNA polymerase III subunit gamma/tau [Sulfurimicrobium sp.]MDZ7655960.1 DNA polymerase III subunit gamma/tau [Sulfurimicrobium sp.]